MVTELTPAEVLENFEFLENWEARYAYLVELGESLEPMPEHCRTEQHRVKGCMSQVWVCALQDPARDGYLNYVGDCDTSIIKGVLALLIGLMSGHTPEQIRDMDLDALFNELKLAEHLSPNRHFGIFAVVELMKAQAAARSICSCSRSRLR